MYRRHTGGGYVVDTRSTVKERAVIKGVRYIII